MTPLRRPGKRRHTRKRRLFLGENGYSMLKSKFPGRENWSLRVWGIFRGGKFGVIRKRGKFRTSEIRPCAYAGVSGHGKSLLDEKVEISDEPKLVLERKGEVSRDRQLILGRIPEFSAKKSIAVS